MLNYIIQVILFQVLFLAVYDLLLSKETFFTKNRWYLLGTAVASFVIPLIKIPTFQKAVPQEFTILLPEIVLSPQKVIEQSSWYENINYVQLLIWLGSALFFTVFITKLIKIIRLIFSNEIIKKSNFNLVLLPKQTKAFSFFNYIFLGKEISENQKEKIIQHELVHSKQKHSADLLFFEFLKIIMWFNPMIWLYQNRITLVHEYISDAVVTKETTKENYINNILSDLFQVESISFINQFYKHSLIKKRIIMMTKQKSKQIKQLKYLLLVPVLLSMLFYTACTNESNSTQELVTKKELTTIYLKIGDKYNKVMKGKKETYLDYYQGTKEPNWTEIYYEDLLTEEKIEFKEKEKRVSETLLNKPTSEIFETKLYVKPDGRKVIGIITDFSKMKRNKTVNEDGSIPYSHLDKAPTFPGCPAGDKDCFNKKMREHFVNNFDVKIANSLGLKKGKQRIYTQFKISKEGKIIDIKARAPHPDLKVTAEQIVKQLPQMKPGEKDGKKVNVGYTLPITFNVD